MRSASFILIIAAAIAAILGSAIPAMGHDKLGLGDNVSVQVTHGGELFCGRLLGEHNLINGTPANDVLNGMDKADLIRGFEGNDKLMGDAGNDRLHRGAGDDSIDGVSGQYVCYDKVGNSTVANCEKPGAIKEEAKAPEPSEITEQ